MRSAFTAVLIFLLSAHVEAQVREIVPGEPYVPPRSKTDSGRAALTDYVKLKLKYQTASFIGRAIGAEVIGGSPQLPDTGYNYGMMQVMTWTAGIQGVVAYEPDNSIYITGESEDIGLLIERIRSMDVRPRPIAVTGRVLVGSAVNQNGFKLELKSSGLTISGLSAHLKSSMESPIARGPGSELASASFDLDINPRLLGDGAIQIDSDLYLDISWRVPGSAKPARMKNVFRSHSIAASGKEIVVTTAGLPLPSGLANLSLRLTVRPTDTSNRPLHPREPRDKLVTVFRARASNCRSSRQDSPMKNPARTGPALALFAIAVGQAAYPQFRSPLRDSLNVSPLETRLLCQKKWIRGAPAAIRLTVTDHRTGEPVPAHVEMSLHGEVDLPRGRGKYQSRPVQFTGRVNPLGTLDVSLPTRNAYPGAYDLDVTVSSALGEDKLNAKIQVVEDTQIMLVSDKPVYQPGQKMRMRLLAIDRGTREAVEDKPFVLEVETPRGDKVFKRKAALTRFGLGGGEFQLADEIVMGIYTLRATVGNASVEKKVRVERYRLPKFKVAIRADRSFYRPGERLTGTIQADYFYGKPVVGARATIELSATDTDLKKIGEIQGKTDANGSYRFEYTLPEAFLGDMIAGGRAMLGIRARIRDAADQAQEANTSIPVTTESIDLIVQPEGGTLAPGMANLVYLAAASPDGSPIPNARIEITTDQGERLKTVTTDSFGIASCFLTPAKAPTIKVAADVFVPDGRRGRIVIRLNTRTTKESIILRSDRAIARVGDDIHLAAFTSADRGVVYFDVINNGQTILTRSQVITNGQAPLVLPLTTELTGTLLIHAYRIRPDDSVVRDTRTVIVRPADDLDIRIKSDQAAYRPGGEAAIKISVSDKRKRPVSAALGIAIVDESVFALSELKPGLEQVYFELEQALMSPKFEVHGLSAADLLLNPAGQADGAEVQRAAFVVLARYQPQEPLDYRLNSYIQRWDRLRGEAQRAVAEDHLKIVRAVEAYSRMRGARLPAQNGISTLLTTGFLRESDLLDPWGNEYKLILRGARDLNGWFSLHSAGPDGEWDTNDDLNDISWFNQQRGFGGGGGGGFGGFGGGGFGGGRGGGAMSGGMRAGRDEPAEPTDVEDTSLMKNLRSLASPEQYEMQIVGTRRGDSTAAETARPTVAEPRVRSYFPETMFWAPDIITDEAGEAELKIPIADSITTWRMSLMANTRKGLLGSAAAPLKVFQSFFVDLDLPIALTQNDRVEIPVSVYNYHDGPQDVQITLQTEPWFTLDGDASRRVALKKDEVSVVYFPITVHAIGRHTISVKAMGAALADAVRRPVEVLPDGKEQDITVSDRVSKVRELTIQFPPNAIEGSRSLFVKIYPGIFGQIVEGMESMLQMPYGCFEQTTSTLYPDVMALAYMKQTGRLTPEIEMKAEHYINAGYQRLLTFEVPSGGFSLYGQAPARSVLTAYGLLELADLAKVRDIDTSLTVRMQKWLAALQQPDGSFRSEDGQESLRRTGFILWALIESGYTGPEIQKAVAFVKSRAAESNDPYTLALSLISVAAKEPDGESAQSIAAKLVGLAQAEGDTLFWSGAAGTFTGARQSTADIETTGLAAYSLLRAGRGRSSIDRVLAFLVRARGSYGSWGTTQGTVWAMKALVLASMGGMAGDKKVTIYANGAKAATLTISKDDSDVMRQLDLAEFVRVGENEVTLSVEGEGSVFFQALGRYSIPWRDTPPNLLQSPVLTIDVAYDKTELSRNDRVLATATVKNISDRQVENAIVELGIPPGFDLIPDRLEAAVAARRISRFTQTGRQIVIYVDRLLPSQELQLQYELRARFPVKVRTPRSAVYPYYNPEQVSIAPPKDIHVAR